MTTHQDEQDKRQREQGSTYLGFTHSDIGGRFGGTDIGKETVIGRDLPNYPEGPAWCAGDQALEPPLNYSVDQMDPVGTAKEIQASLERSGETVLPSGQPDGGEARSDAERLLGVVEQRPPSTDNDEAA